MTPNDLKSGYVVRLRSGEYAWVHSFSWFDIETGKREELLAICNKHTYYPVSSLNDDFEYVSPKRIFDNDVVLVYGFAFRPLYAGVCSCDERDCLWEKKGLKYMTLQQVCEALGEEIIMEKDFGFSS